jgi:cell division FtsZ-interacting protein ZapD
MLAAELHLRVEPAPSSGQLQACSRYVARVAEQLEALERGELARVRELDSSRQALEQEIRAAGVPQEIDEILRTGLQEVRRRVASEQAVRELWSGLRDQALRSARRIARPVTRGRYPDPRPTDARFDIRL